MQPRRALVPKNRSQDGAYVRKYKISVEDMVRSNALLVVKYNPLYS